MLLDPDILRDELNIEDEIQISEIVEFIFTH